MAELAVVLGFRNRDLERVARCLDSLAAQTFQDFEVIFVDYGSDPCVAEAAQRVVEAREQCRYIYTEARGYPWNRARTLNIGGKMADSEYVMTTDADMVFPPGFVQTILAEARESRVLYCGPHYLPCDFQDWSNIASYEGAFPVASRSGLGGFQCVASRVFRSIRGFDEYYQYWGVEDRDIHQRLMKMGLEEVWMNDKTAMFHQWHPPVDVKTAGLMPDGHWARMQCHYYRYADQVVRNGDDWGRVYKCDDRPVFRFLDFEKGRLIPSSDLAMFEGRFDNNRDVGNFVRQFWELPSGHALALDGANLPQRFGWLDKALGGINRGLRVLGTQARVGYAPNLLHAYLVEFIEDNRDIVLDYYLGFPERNGASLLMRA